jgi:C4-dicarboxylate-specific signal transduction histidine kinase
MAALDTLNFPALESALNSAAGLANNVYLPAATPGSVAVALAAVPCLLALLWLARRLTARPRAENRTNASIDELSQRLQTMELLLADATSETAQLRQRVDQLTSKQESIAAGNSQSTLRQAIALSKHGATTRQLIDTCSLSQGEAHLIQNLYGRPPGDAQPDELH